MAEFGMVGVDPENLGEDELSSILSTLGSANFAWVMHRLAVEQLASHRAMLETADPGKPGTVGKLQGMCLVLSGLPNAAAKLKQLLERTIENKRAKEETNGG